MKKLLLFTIVLALTLSMQNAFAASTTWTGAVSTDWATPGNWTAGVPADGDDVTVPNGTTNLLILTTTTAVLKSFALNNAAATLTISSGGNLKVGIASGTTGFSLLGTTTIDMGGQLTISGDLSNVNLTGDFTNNGTINIKDDALLTFDQTLPKKAINNGTILVSDNGSLIPNAGVLENNGIITIASPTATLLLSNNSGILNKSGGVINNAGIFIVGITNTLTNDGTINNTGSYSSTGTYAGTGNFNNSTSTGKVLADGVDCNSFTKLTLQSTASTHFDLGTGAACTGFDRLAISDLATLAGSFTASGTVAVGNTFIIMTYGTKSGTFSNTSHTITAGKIALMDYTTAGQVKINIVATLPIELLSFKATPSVSSNLLTWATANEVNNKGFQVERLMDNGQWIMLGFVNAKGKAASYDFTDNTPLSTSYYRLRQIDNDGKETLSKVVSATIKGKQTLKVYPTLVSNGILTVDTEGGDYAIYNVFGQQVQNGKTTQRLDVSALAKGTYILKVGAEQVKFVKQ